MTAELQAAQKALFHQLDQRFEQDLPGMAQDICQVVAPWYMAVRPSRCVWEIQTAEDTPEYEVPIHTPVTCDIQQQKSHWQTLSTIMVCPFKLQRCVLEQYQGSMQLVAHFSIPEPFNLDSLSAQTLRLFFPPKQDQLSPWLAVLCDGIKRVQLSFSGQYVDLPKPELDQRLWQLSEPDKGACLWLEWLRYPTQFCFINQPVVFPQDRGEAVRQFAIHWTIDPTWVPKIQDWPPELSLHCLVMENRYKTDLVPFTRSSKKQAYLLQAPSLHQTQPLAIAKVAQVKSWHPQKQQHISYKPIGRFGLGQAQSWRGYSMRYLQSHAGPLRWQIQFAPRPMSYGNQEVIQIQADCYQPDTLLSFSSTPIKAMGQGALHDTVLTSVGMPCVPLQPDFAIAHWLVGHLSQRHFALDSMQGWQEWWRRCAIGLPELLQKRVLGYQHGLLDVAKKTQVQIQRDQACSVDQLTLTFAPGSFASATERWLFGRIWQGVLSQHVPLTRRYVVCVIEQSA